MVVAITDLREVTDDHDPGSANLSMKGGKAKMSYWWTSTNVADFQAMARLILGQVDSDSGSGSPGSGHPGILRTLPVCHPRFPTLYAETISDYAGLGGAFIKEASGQSVGGASSDYPVFPEYARYPEYRLDIEFANRLYPIVSNTDLGGAQVIAWNDDTGTGANVAMKCWDTFEYNRWTWITGGPKENILTAKQGQMVLDVAGTAQVFPNMPQMPMPDGVVKITWYEVPWSFVRPERGGPSYFQQYMGRVNQFDFLNWRAGELLYITIQPRPYTCSLPDAVGKPVYLCDIDILCLETSRLLAAGDPVPAPALANWIAEGWNLQPFWKDRQFHYAHVGALASAPGGQAVPANKQTPTWKSFPIQMLWSNPDTALPP